MPGKHRRIRRPFHSQRQQKMAKKLLEQYTKQAREIGFVLDCGIATKDDYDPFNDKFLDRFFTNNVIRKNLKSSGLVNKKGQVVDRMVTSFFSQK